MSTFPAAQWIAVVVFVLCLATTIGGALFAVSTTRLIRGVCGLAMACIGLAGLYYFLHSPFLALMEILIYVGAVCVTIVFAIMLAEPDEPKGEETSANALGWGSLAVAVAGAIFWGLWRLGSGASWSAVHDRVNDGSMKAIGVSLLTTYSLAFEIISIALLVAILGALAIARTGRSKP